MTSALKDTGTRFEMVEQGLTSFADYRRAGDRIVGPAIVEQYDTTTIVPPDFVIEVDRYGNLDATYYQSWGPDLWQAWIVAPFQKYYAQFPRKCLAWPGDARRPPHSGGEAFLVTEPLPCPAWLCLFDCVLCRHVIHPAQAALFDRTPRPHPRPVAQPRGLLLAPDAHRQRHD